MNATICVLGFSTKCCGDLKIQSDGLAASVHSEAMRVFTKLNTTYSGKVQYGDGERRMKLWFSDNTWKVAQVITQLSMKQNNIKISYTTSCCKLYYEFYRSTIQ